MTQNQIAAAKAAEDARHNRVTEQLQSESNKITSEHYQLSDTATKQHYERSDAINQAHYERSDAAGLISANANALNAETNRKKYQMEYDIEYNWTGDFGYPEGMPLSAQRKNAELEMLTLIDPVFVRPTVPAYVTDEKTGQLREPTTREVAYGIDMHTMPAKIYAKKEKQLGLVSEAGKTIQSYSSALFGKSGLYNAVTSIVDDTTR